MMRNVLKGCTAALALSTALTTMAEAKDYRVAVIRWEPNDIYFNGVALGQQQEAERIDEDVALASLDLLARIEALRIKRRAPF